MSAVSPSRSARRSRSSRGPGGSAIFDAPGPRGRITVVWVTVLSILGIVAAGWLAVRQFAINGQLDPGKWAEFAQWPTQRYLLGAFGNTLLAAGGAAAIALPLGLLLALGRLDSRRPLRWAATAVIEFFRAIPLLLLIYIFFVALPQYGLNPDLFWKLVIPIGLCSAATVAEVFRAGVLALPKGQSEAGAVIGLTDSQTFRYVIFPQAVRMVVPSLVAQVVILLKDTTLGYVVSYSELQHSARVLVASTGHLIQTYLVVSVFYVLINIAISGFARWLDQRSRRRGAGRRAVRTEVPVEPVGSMA
ncbi:MAG: amino acid ABC transporter permease [Propionicimonas sp.]|uniref:amino acid ABC transporter permease n=1 Tax=Propionicimonas sp. TaxID=1955623 RepID=UPI002B2129FB|nr:amino acid ABC transporter permease [Propionicimonas sp.]MEA4945428.1 amino acid ABC transporter permease [Propionicimonas sp.]